MCLSRCIEAGGSGTVIGLGWRRQVGWLKGTVAYKLASGSDLVTKASGSLSELLRGRIRMLPS